MSIVLKGENNTTLECYENTSDRKIIKIEDSNDLMVYIFDSDEEIGVFITMLEKLKNNG